MKFVKKYKLLFWLGFSIICLLQIGLAKTPQTSKKLKIERIDTPYVDWNTGMPRTRTDFKLKLSRTTLDVEKIKKLINLKHPGLLTFPAIYDAVEIGTDDLLIAMTRDSQGQPYPIVRVHIVRGQLAAELIEVGGLGSPWNWFPDSRIKGWSRVRGLDSNQYMIRWSPFAVFNIGHGDLAKVEYPYAFLAEDKSEEGKIAFRAVDLMTGTQTAVLELDRNCFRLPEFSFDHPQLDRNNKNRNDEYVTYKYGPDWWDKNIEVLKTNNLALKLKPNHLLSAPRPRVLSVEYVEEKDRSQNLMKHDREEEEIDRLPITDKNCEIVNPKGVEKAKVETSETLSTTPAVFCLNEDSMISPDLKKKVCGPISRKTVFSKGVVKLNEVAFVYHSQLKSFLGKSFAISTPELSLSGESYTHLKNPEGYGSEQIKSFEILNANQILIKARSDGPWNLYVVTAINDNFDLKIITSFAYPGSEIEEASNKNYLYFRNGRVLIQKSPFKYWEGANDIFTIQNSTVVSLWSNSNGDSEFIVWDSTIGDERNYGFGTPLWRGKVASSCLIDLQIPDLTKTLAEKENWFHKNFIWQNDKKILSFSKDRDKCRWKAN